MEHALRESERIGDAQVKYYKKLDTLWDLRNTNNMQRSAITTELNEMKALRDKQVKNVVENFEAMQNREREIGKGLIFTKTAKEIPEKVSPIFKLLLSYKLLKIYKKFKFLLDKKNSKS